MYRAFVSSADLRGRACVLCSTLCQRRYWTKPKKRPKVGAGFHEKAQMWRDEFLLDRHRVLADSLRAYVDFSVTKRAEPWDTRFAPFDRAEKDGVYVLTRHLMDEKLQLCNYHHRPVKRLLCNVGLLGPQVTTTARWKPLRYATNAATTTRAEVTFNKDKTRMRRPCRDAPRVKRGRADDKDDNDGTQSSSARVDDDVSVTSCVGVRGASVEQHQQQQQQHAAATLPSSQHTRAQLLSSSLYVHADDDDTNERNDASTITDGDVTLTCDAATCDDREADVEATILREGEQLHGTALQAFLQAHFVDFADEQLEKLAKCEALAADAMTISP